MNLFLDTNILIDLVADRKPFSGWVIKMFQEAKRGKWKLYTSSSSILTTYYIVSKEIGSVEAKKLIAKLLKRIEVLPIQKKDLLSAIGAEFKDYEDAVQHECAINHSEIDFIITRNKKDYKDSVIPVLSSEELFIKNS